MFRLNVGRVNLLLTVGGYVRVKPFLYVKILHTNQERSKIIAFYRFSILFLGALTEVVDKLSAW